MKPSFDFVWKKIIDNTGNKFKTKTKITFTYKIENNYFIPLCPKKAPQNITKAHVEEAYNQWPVTGPGDFSGNILAPSYLWGVFNDDRIIKKDE